MEVAHQQLMDVLMPHTAARKADERCKQQDAEAAVRHAKLEPCPYPYPAPSPSPSTLTTHPHHSPLTTHHSTFTHPGQDGHPSEGAAPDLRRQAARRPQDHR